MTTTDPAAHVEILGVPVTATTLAHAVDTVAGWVTQGQSSYATFADVHSIMQATRSSAMLTAHRNAGLVACDGMPLVWLSRLAGVKSAERVYGPDFTLRFCGVAAEKGWRAFFLGGRPGVADELAARLQRGFPGLQVAGTLSPPLRALSPHEDADIVATINDSDTDVVFVGLGCPKQELWMSEHISQIQAGALLGVGAAFDFLSGTVRQAPRWVQRSGFEWLFRTMTEPGRLGRRYLRNIPAFLASVAVHRPHVIDETAR